VIRAGFDGALHSLTKVIWWQLLTAARAAALSTCVGREAVGGIRSEQHIDSAAGQRSPNRFQQSPAGMAPGSISPGRRSMRRRQCC
jgi:hypothetical protein